MANRNLKKEEKELGEKLSHAAVMVAAVRAGYMRSLTRFVVDDASILKLEELIRITSDAKDRLEILKDELRGTTDSVEACKRYMGKKYSEIKEMIKTTVPHREWKKFGIDDVQ